MSILAIQAYRSALRATRVAFRGDSVLMDAARQKIREGFEANRELSKQEETEKAISEINSVAKFLVKNVVQAEKQQSDRYLLKIHDQTELGLNETIKQNNRKDMGSLTGVKISRCR